MVLGAQQGAPWHGLEDFMMAPPQELLS